MRPGFLIYGLLVVLLASIISWSEVVDRAGGSGWRSSSGSGGWSSGGHK